MEYQKVYQILKSESKDPYEILGFHEYPLDKNNKASIIRAFIPDAIDVTVINETDNKEYEMIKTHEDGIFQIILTEAKEYFPYRFRITNNNGDTIERHDPYCFLPTLSNFDLHLISEGNHDKVYEKLGAHPTVINGIAGVIFAVWAPNAKRVSVIGDFNNWNGKRHQMRTLGLSGIWEIFIPELTEYEVYQYEIKTYDDRLIKKADPHGFFSELRPRTCSIVYNVDRYKWNDKEWMDERKKKNFKEEPMSIYEVHLGSWLRTHDENHPFLNYKDIAHALVDYIKKMNYTHIELLPIAEHPFDGSWGYQVTGYFSPTSRFGTPADFMYLIDYCHQNDIGVILDWVPAHFPEDPHAIAEFDGTHLYEHADPRQGKHMDWGTSIFNFGRNEVRNFLISNALFFLEKYHIDGIRIDAVASMLYLDYSRQADQWVPNKYGGRENLESIFFLQKLNDLITKYHPGVLIIAEESTAWPSVTKPTYLGGLGFHLKWNMGWMNDTLSFFKKDPLYRKFHHNLLTFTIFYAFSENFILVLSHDEVVHLKNSLLNKMPGDMWQKIANLKLLFGYMYAHPGKKLLFMGGDIAQPTEWNHDSSLPWDLMSYEPHYKFNRFMKDLNKIYKEEKAFFELDTSPDGFEWINFEDTDTSIISFIRKAKNKKDMLIFVCNFTPMPRHNYKVGVPYYCEYKELLNSDAEIYWGSNMGNAGGFHCDKIEADKKPYSLNLTVPPLSISVFKPLIDLDNEEEPDK